MEKFQKYCLGVLLVIICSNVPAQASSTGCFENEDCRQLYEWYQHILNPDCSISQKPCVKKEQKVYLAISRKQHAADLIGTVFCTKVQTHYYHDKAGAELFKKQKHSQALQDFEKSNKAYASNDILYFKAKVSKIRNKDYLMLMS